MPRASRLGLGAILALAGLVYLLLLGATVVGELSPNVAIVNAVVAIPLLWAYGTRAPREADGVDHGVLLTILLFTVCCVLSLFPRQSFEAAIAAVIYGAALFVARGMLSRSAARMALVYTLIGVSAALTTITAVRWGGFVLEWMTLAEWRTIPPLNMELPSIPWGHRHDLALLVVMLYPAWWVSRPSRLRQIAAVAIGIVVAAIVLIDGSRMLWLAVLAASLLTGAMMLWRRKGFRRSLTSPGFRRAASSMVIAVVVVMLLGLTSALGERLANFESVGWRTAMWSSLVDWWIEHPLAGGGPGSFPWILQGTDYFDTTSFAPRHPDSAPIQLLAEGGLVGIGALVALLAAVIPPLLRANAPAPLWALTAFAVASLGANSTDFPFMVIIAVTWVAYALPRPSIAPSGDVRMSRRGVVVRGVTGLAAVVVAAAWGLTVIAAISYGNARASISDGNFEVAHQRLDQAAALDPSMAMYPRQRGTLRLASSEPDAALDDLRLAVALNHFDALAWRTLSLAADAAGDEIQAHRALQKALDLRRSDPTLLLMAAQREANGSEADAALELLAEVVQAWPAIVFAPGWDAFVSDLEFDTDRILSRATDRWMMALPSPEMITDQGLWLVVLSDRKEALPEALLESGHRDRMGAAMVALLRCDAATPILNNAPGNDLRNATHWRLRVRDAAITGEPEGNARSLLEHMTRLSTEGTIGTLNPLRENSIRGTSADLWGYRRAPVDWPSIDMVLPSPTAGLAAWTEGAGCDGQEGRGRPAFWSQGASRGR